MEEDPTFAPGDETSPTAATGKQESRDRKILHPTTKAKTSAKKPKKNQDDVRAETVTSRESDKTQVQNSVNITQDEDDSPQRYVLTHSGSNTEVLMANVLGTMQAFVQQQSSGQSELKATLKTMGESLILP